MINLLTFFKNHFDTSKLSDDKIRLFAEVNIVRLTNDTSGLYSDLLTDTSNAYNDFFGVIVNESTRFAVQQGRTIGMNNAWNGFLKLLRQKEGTIRGEFDKDSPTYQEFFPHGMFEYTQAALGSKQTLMNRFIAACNNNAAALPANFVDQFVTLRNTFVSVRDLQLTVISEVTNLKDNARISRDVLEEQLMKNVLFVAFNNVGHPERMKRFFDQTILGVVASDGNDIFRKKIAANELKNLFDINDYAPDTRLKLRNPGATKLYFELLPTATSQPNPATAIVLEPGASLTIHRSDIANPQGAYFNVWNPETVQGKYEVEVVEG